MSNEVVLVFSTLGVTLLFAATGLAIYNRLVRSQVRTQEAWSGIDVQLRRRASLIPNLVESVRGYASHERGLFEEVTRARSAVDRSRGPAEAGEANRGLSDALSRLFVVVENYPELQASQNFRDLQDRLADVEEKIAYARQFYNSNVARFNIQIRAIPDVLIARLLGLEAFEFFEAEEHARSDIQVRFPLAPARASAGTDLGGGVEAE